MTPAEVLRRAANLIDSNGLAHGSFRTTDGRHCAIGAIRNVLSWAENEHYEPSDYRAMMDAVRLEVNPNSDNNFTAITEWNDNSEKGEVVETLRRVATKMEDTQEQ